MHIQKSGNNMGLIGICGHAGIGHTHSHSGFVQDDSAGLAVTASMLKKALPVDTIIKSVDINLRKSMITVRTNDDGIGQVWVRRGITPSEMELMKRIVGLDSIYSQWIVLKTFGRIYGQGVMEVPVSLQAAIVLSLIDTFEKNWAKEVKVVREDVSPNIGKILGTVIEIDDIPVSMLLTVNSSLGGIGPIEDLEGNIALGAKGQLMKELGLDKLPTIIIESKSFVPSKASSLRENTFLIRAHHKFDNLIVARNLVEATQETDLVHTSQFNELERDIDDFSETSRAFGSKVVQLGEQLKVAVKSEEKVKIIADLAVLISQDAGGVTFMSNDLQKDVGSAGMLKGTSAVLSLLVTKNYIDQHKIPFITERDINNYITIIYKGIKKLYSELDIALEELESKYTFNAEKYYYLFGNMT